MINAKTTRDVSDLSDEGKMLVAAIAVLTTIDKDDLDKKEWGRTITPDDAISRITDLANRIYHEEEWNIEKVKIDRNNKIEKIINDEKN